MPRISLRNSPNHVSLLLSLGLFLGLPAVVQGHAGLFAFDSLTRPLTASQTALGGLQASGEGGSGALRANPALLALFPHAEFCGSHQSWQTGLRQEWVGGTLPAGSGAIGMGVSAVHAGELPGFTEEGTPLGSFRPVEMIAGAGYARPLAPGLLAGIALNALYLDGPAEDLRGISGDVGFQFSFATTRVALSMRNLGPDTKSERATYRLPTAAAIGLEQELGYRLRLQTTVALDRDQSWTAIGGARLDGPGGVSFLGGLAYRDEAITEPLSPRVGLLLSVRFLQVAYAFVPSEETGSTHQLSLEFSPR